MASFTPSLIKQFTNTCQNLKVIDTSNYGIGNNNENYTKDDFSTKKVVLKDIFGTTLAMKDIDSNGEANFDLTLLSLSQLYLNISLQVVGVNISYNLEVGAYLPCIL